MFRFQAILLPLLFWGMGGQAADHEAEDAAAAKCRFEALRRSDENALAQATVRRQQLQNAPFDSALKAMVGEAISLGPNRWVNPTGAKIQYARGVSGLGLSPNGKKADGYLGAIEVLTASAPPDPSYVFIVPRNNLKKATEAVGGYANPLAIAGAGATIHPSDDQFDLPTGVAALSASDTRALAIVVPTTVTDYYPWALNYLKLMKKLEREGMVPASGSRGEKFLREVESIWELRESQYGTPTLETPVTDLRNRKLIESELRALYQRNS